MNETMITAFLLCAYAIPIVAVFAAMAGLAQLLERYWP